MIALHRKGNHILRKICREYRI